MSERGNRTGGAYALTTFAPVIAGREDALEAYLEAMPLGAESPLARIETLHLSRIQLAVERAGLHTRHVEDFPDDYARTLLEWQNRFESNIDRARELAGDERVRVWRIYLRVSRQGFESGFISVYQVRAVKPE